VGGVVAVDVGEGGEVAVGVSVGNGVREAVGDGGTKPVVVRVGVRVMVGSMEGAGVAEAGTAVGEADASAVGVAGLGARRMTISPAQ
jgi:hypothetical protein